jgi:hypothetical protein
MSMSQMRASATFLHAAMPLTMARSTSGRERFCAMETMTFGKSTQFTVNIYDKS